jgi:hypothetical protein
LVRSAQPKLDRVASTGEVPTATLATQARLVLDEIRGGLRHERLRHALV